MLFNLKTNLMKVEVQKILKIEINKNDAYFMMRGIEEILKIMREEYKHCDNLEDKTNIAKQVLVLENWLFTITNNIEHTTDLI